MWQKLMIAIMLTTLAATAWLTREARQALLLEQREHAATLAALRQVTESRDAWIAACNEALDTARAQRDNAAACLQREAAARTDAAERAAIVRQARPHTQTADERNKVVDNETRKRAAARLNRPL